MVRLKRSLSNGRKNALAGVSNILLVGLVGFFLNPLFASFLGSSNFGIWKSAQRIVDLAGTLDGGALQTLKWVLASSKHKSLAEKRSVVVSLSRLLFRWLPVMVLASIVLIVGLPSFISLDSAMSSSEIYLIGGLLALNVIVTVLGSVPDSILVGVNEGYRSTWITSLVFVTSNFVMAYLCFLGAPLVILSLVLVIAASINGWLTYQTVKRRVQWLLTTPDKTRGNEDFSSASNPILGWAIINRVTASMEIMLLAALTNPETVTAYFFCTFSLQFASGICQLATSARTPALGSSIALPSSIGISDRMICEIRQINIFLATVFTSAFITLNAWFVQVWAGPNLYLGHSLNLLIALSFFQLMLLRVDGQIQDTTLKVKSKLTIGAISTATSILLAFMGYAVTQQIWGILIGVILGRLIMNGAFPILVWKTTKIGNWPVGRIFASLAILVIVATLETFLAPSSVFQGFVIFLLAASAALLTCLDSVTRGKIFRF